ncbi:MFS transporter [Methylobacterium sp. J-076]|uniref:MFS transporter n=1 Tax=Methylobacterium sp. J-076 TaxID=2836655 RepID=UPI001FB8E7B2|nr:MFS transporter [Methylobacterium sp. J-076]MCJ2013649.1 MFS transporter [Methylobacterium sp. J-076]
MPAPTLTAPPRRTATTLGNAALGLTQIILWGGSFFLIAVIVGPVVESTGWPQGAVIGALSLAILISGLLSPWIGTRIRQIGGRPVLIVGTLVMALGLVLMALSPNLAVFLAAWAVMGVGMAGALYDPLFAAIGQAYGASARSAMTQIAIASGFAITVCWPASSFLVAHVGWRGACLAYAALAAFVVAPIFALALPGGRPLAYTRTAVAPGDVAAVAKAGRLAGEGILALTFTTAAILMTAVSVELLLLLEAQGISAASAVALSALIGPSQVGARVIELAFGQRAHPIHLLLISAGSVALGLLLLVVAPGLAWLAILLYGAGNGMRTVVRGTLPLALYGQGEYAAVIGRLARPPLLGQAATPLACGYAMEVFGIGVLSSIMLAVAVLNLGLSLEVARRVNRRSP